MVRNMRKPYSRQSICLGFRGERSVSRTSQGPLSEPLVRISRLFSRQHSWFPHSGSWCHLRRRDVVGGLHYEGTLDDPDGPEPPGLSQVVTTRHDLAMAETPGPRPALHRGDLLVGATVDLAGLGFEGDGDAEVELEGWCWKHGRWTGEVRKGALGGFIDASISLSSSATSSLPLVRCWR